MYISKLIKKQTTIAVITIITLSIIALSSSYALFQDTFVDEDNTQTLNVADLTVAFSNGGGTALTDANAINVTMQPMSDADATDPSYLSNLYTFAVSNSGDIPYTYTIKLINNPAYQVGGANYDANMVELSSAYIRYKLNDFDINFLDVAEENNNSIIYKYTINPGEIDTYTLRLWVADSDTYDVPNSVIGAERHLNILIEGEASEFRAPDGWHTAKEGTLLNGIKKNQNRAYNANYNPNSITLTVPGRAVSTTNEGLRETLDDYGTSFYYRGAVENNYVVFADMCWRIVRVTGDGSIKLVLYNYNSNSVTNPCATSEDGTTKAFARIDNTYDGTFTDNSDSNTYIGYMFSDTPNANDYDGTHSNDYDSDVLSFLREWYYTYLLSYNSKIADVIWCNDKSPVTDTTFDPWQLGTILDGTGIGSTGAYYSAVKRITPVSSANPSMVCPTAGNDGKISKFTSNDLVHGNAKLFSDNIDFKIGLLTADEVAFAGSTIYINNNTAPTYYLSKNSTGKGWWTLSPGSFDGRDVINLIVSPNCLNYEEIDRDNGYRPAIALKSNVKYTVSSNTNPGTASNPFIIS